MNEPFHDAPVLVTGAAGFIGSHVVEALLARAQRVVAIDNFDPFYDPAIKRRSVETCARHPNSRLFEFHTLDITDPHAVHSLFAHARPAGVIHLAARAGVRPSIADPVGYARTNLTGTAILLDAARALHPPPTASASPAACSRFVLASSSSVYGNSARAPFREDETADEPISPYAATKRACELLAHAHAHLSSMPTACLRFFTVFGPRQRPDLAISQFLARISRDEPIHMFGDGSTRRDYTFISDIVHGVLSAYERIPDHSFRVWNLGNSSPVTLRDMIAAIARTVGREARVVARPMQPGDVQETYADLTRSAAELGFRPSTPFEHGLKEQWEWMKHHL